MTGASPKKEGGAAQYIKAGNMGGFAVLLGSEHKGASTRCFLCHHVCLKCTHLSVCMCICVCVCVCVCTAQGEDKGEAPCFEHPCL